MVYNAHHCSDGHECEEEHDGEDVEEILIAYVAPPQKMRYCYTLEAWPHFGGMSFDSWRRARRNCFAKENGPEETSDRLCQTAAQIYEANIPSCRSEL